MKTARARVLIYSTADRYWRRESGLPTTYKQEQAVRTTDVKNSSERNKTAIQGKVDSPLLTSKSRLFEQRMSRIHLKETKQRSRGKWTPHYLQARAGCSNLIPRTQMSRKKRRRWLEQAWTWGYQTNPCVQPLKVEHMSSTVYMTARFSQSWI